MLTYGEHGGVNKVSTTTESKFRSACTTVPVLVWNVLLALCKCERLMCVYLTEYR
jgi:hypothetical protein